MSRRTVIGAAALIAALAAIMVIGFRRQLPEGVQLAGGRAAAATAGVRGRQPAVDPGPCLALPRAIRSSSPRLTLISRGVLSVVSLARCTDTTVIAAGAQAPVRVSANGRWVGEGAAVIASVAGDQVQRPLGAHVWSSPTQSTWAWAPRGQTLAGVTTGGGVVIGHPNLRPTEIRPAGWGATSVVFDGPGAVLVTRGLGQLWRLPLRGGRARLIYRDRSPSAVLQLALTAGGSAIAWREPELSASALSDGVPLVRIALSDGRLTQLARAVIAAPGYVVPCGTDVAAVVGFGRDATKHKTIVLFSAAGHARTLGAGVTPTCSADGRTIAYASGPAQPGLEFGDERRTIRLAVPGRRTRVVSRPAGSGPGANTPVLSPDGRVVFWVQASARAAPHTSGVGYRGVITAALTGTDPHRTGPILSAGTTTDYYGTLSWSTSVAPLP